MKKTIPLLIFVLMHGHLHAQSTTRSSQRFLKLAVSNSHSAKPFGSFSSLFYENFHPGIDLGYETVLKNKKKHQWIFDARAAYMFHRFVQQNIAVYVNAGYRYAVWSMWSAEAKLGAGYQLSIPHNKLFTISENEGLKKKNNFGRSQVIGNLALAVNRKISSRHDTRIFLEYKQQIQTPFIKEYVPVLPYNSMLIGLALPVNYSKAKQKA